MMDTDSYEISWDILDTYFQKGGSAESVNPHVKHQIESYNKFIESTLGHIITGFNPLKIQNTFKNENGNASHKININVTQPSLTKPYYHLPDGTQTIMTPYLARMNKLSYSSSLYVNIHIFTEVTNNDGIIEKFDKTINGVYIGKIPVMVRSKACVLHQIPGLGEENNNECRYDYGGYFIINGSEKVLISQDRINENKTHVFQPSNNNEGLYAEIRSMDNNTYLPTKTTSLNMSGKLNHMGRIIRINTSFIRSEIPVFVMFRALGILSDKEIIQHIVYDLDNEDNKRIITELMACCEDASDIHTQQEAEQLLIKIMTSANKTNNPIELLKSNIINDFLPHVGKNYRRKALYLGFMVRKMIRIYLGYDNYDNRDSYINKKIDTPGILMSNLFRQCYGKMTKEIKCLVEKELNLWRSNQTNIASNDIISDNNIHRYFRQSMIESWLKYSLSTGNWGIKVIGSFQTIRQGVSQVLNRMSYASTLSHLRRINTSMEKNGKLVQPRKLDNSQIGMICPAETPEGASVGLVKNMALSTNISLTMNSSHIIELLIDNGVKVYNDIEFSYNIENEEEWYKNSPETNIKLEKITDFLRNLGNINNAKVQVNGDIIGYHGNPDILYKTFKHYKRCGKINPITSLVWNIKNNFIIISTEAGRMYRPLLIVDIDNTGKRELRINKILKERKITWKEYIKDKNFDYFIAPCVENNSSDNNVENEGFIEYLDSEEINSSMIAMFPYELEKGMKGTAYPPFYTHCEIHPSLINGILGVNIPFSDHNQSPRNCYQCISENENVLMSNGTYKKIKNIVIGDEVVCFNLKTNMSEHTKVVHHYNRYTTKIVYNINLVNGRTITATNDHNFMTNDGWKNCTEFTSDTLVGIHIKSNYKNVNNFYENSENATYTILNVDEYSDIYKELNIMPLNNDNKMLPVIAKLAGYYYHSKLNFRNEYDKELYDKDAKYIGFAKYGLYDNAFIYYINMLSNNIDWLYKCSNMIQNNFLSGYLSALYPETFDNISNIDNDITDNIILHIMSKNLIENDWYSNDNSINKLYKNIGLCYNTKLISEIAITCEYNIHKEYTSLIANNKTYTYENWKSIVYVNGDLIYIPFNIIYKNRNRKISDITVESDNHCFIAGNGFAVSNCAMGKQALGIYTSNFNKRIDTMGNILNYVQKPLVYTRLSKYTYSNELPSGTNAIVAIMTHTGFNQEDSVMINQSALDRGLFTSTYYKSVKEQCSKNHSTGEEERFTNPVTSKAVSLKPFSYDKIDENGIIPKNTKIDGNDIIIGKIMPKKTNGVIVNQDNSLSLKTNDEGYVDMNYMGTNSDGYKFCNVRIRKNRKPEIGDKLACFSPDHEYLTSDGWVSMTDLTLDHYLATSFNGDLMYQKPIKLHKFKYEGDMYSLENDEVCLETTPNHRMLVNRECKKPNWYIKRADEIYNKCFRMKKDVENWSPNYDDIPSDIGSKFVINNGKITHFNLMIYNTDVAYNKLTIDIDSWLLIYSIYISNNTIEDYKNEILKNIEEKEGIIITIEDSKIRIIKKYCNSKLITHHLDIEYVIDITKNLDEWVWWLDRDNAKKLIDNMCACVNSDNYKSLTYSTYSNNIADDFQRLCLHAGYSANKKYENKKYVLYVNTSDISNEPLFNADKSKCQDKWVKYDGYVYCCTVANDASIYVRRNGVVVFTKQSRSAQKGTIGMIYRQQDMPFTKSGITPDIIMNPHAIPSRMTMAQLMECIMGKASCHIGAVGDCTPFTDCSVESIAKVLELSGMERYGNEIMYNGRTGEQIKTEIFVGPTYYQRLKHMVQDKSHSRGSNGPIVMLTRQPSEGRARNGGLRLGEMERDCLIGHGISEFLKEKMLDTSDNYRIFVCKKCGITANVNPSTNTYKCNVCKNYSDIVQIRIPYAFKLLGQELYTMNIKTGFICN